ncbi:MAG: FixH family protein [Alphaproteobacteria bacterium]|nr:MAG: FixH family protein [Alphaproteobacteria bacterium]
MVRASDNKAPRLVTGRTVLLCLIGFFAVVFAVNGIMIRAAVSTFGGVETSSSYQAGLAFSREAAAAHAQDALHWRVTAQVRPARDATLVEIEARDSAGRPLAGLTATAHLVHPNDRRADREVSLSEGATGQFRGSAGALVGQRDIIIELSRDGERLFRSRNRVVLN